MPAGKLFAVVAEGGKSITKALGDFKRGYDPAVIQRRLEPHQKAFLKSARAKLRPQIPVKQGAYPLTYEPLAKYGYIMSTIRRPGTFRRSLKGKQARTRRGQPILRTLYIRLENFPRNFLSGGRRFRGKYSYLNKRQLPKQLLPELREYEDQVFRALTT